MPASRHVSNIVFRLHPHWLAVLCHLLPLPLPIASTFLWWEWSKSYKILSVVLLQKCQSVIKLKQYLFLPVISREIQDGVPVVDSNGNKMGESKVAAKQGIIAVVLSRVGMASPGMGEQKYSIYYINKNIFNFSIITTWWLMALQIIAATYFYFCDTRKLLYQIYFNWHILLSCHLKLVSIYYNNQICLFKFKVLFVKLIFSFHFDYSHSTPRDEYFGAQKCFG